MRIGIVLGLLASGWLEIATPTPYAPALQAAELSADAWPQWRGPARDGTIPAESSDAPWPDRISGGALELLWRVELGPGYPGPIINGNRVFLAETDAERDEVVRALDRATGRELWRARWAGAMQVPFFARANGDWIRATPACDGEVLLVAGMRDVLVCLDAQTGTERWRVDFCQRYGTPLPDFGFASSPLIDGPFVYVQAGASVCKLDKATGATLWRALDDGGGMLGSAFSSPVILTLGGLRQLVVQTRDRLAGVDLDSGKILWSQEVPAFRGMNILTPTTFADGLFTSAYGGRSFLYRISADASVFRVAKAWDNKVQGYMSSPVIIDGHAYLHLRNRRFTCIDLATGKERWTTKPFGEYWSMVALGRRILALDERGELLLIDASPEEFRLLDRHTVSADPTWGHLAIGGDEIFVRELKAIAAYRWRQPPSTPANAD